MYHYKEKYSISAMSQFFGISRAAYYAWQKHLEQPDPNQAKKEMIREAYESSKHTYGYRRVTVWIAKQKGICINHKATLRLMRVMGMQSEIRRRKRRQQGAGENYSLRYPNLLARNFEAKRANQKWGTDVTFIRTVQGMLHLSIIKDLFDGFIVSYEMSLTNSLELVLKTLKKALQKETIPDGLVLHSDQGHQYCSKPYATLLQQHKITASMSRKGDCLDNAPTENFFSHLKTEVIYRMAVGPVSEMKQIIEEYIYFYNYERIQLKTKQTPFEKRCLSI
jgi:transposase InsO family protein